MRLAHTVRSWKVKTTCVVDGCGKTIRHGATHPRDDGDPPRAAMCHGCLSLLLTDEEAFAAAHPA